MIYPKLSEIKNWTTGIENSITKQWREEDPFKFNNKSKKKIYSIDTPPPYINAPIHMGHAVTYCYQDFFARYRRMKGYQVIFPLGLDRNGLPIEMGAEKKFKVSPFEVEREEFIKLCEKLLEETSSESIDSFSKLGISFNSYKKSSEVGAIYHTDSEEYRTLTQSTFIDLFKKGLIYEDTRINNWDPKLQTTIADSEIEYKEIPSLFNEIKWEVKETKEKITIATTRPELICVCGMIIFNPEDERYKHLENKTAISPLYNHEIKIKSHSLADKNKGTGIMMMCSAGDLTDIQFYREQNLTPKIAIEKDGTMNEHAGFLKGLKVKEAREKIIEKLKSKNLIAKQEKISHRTPVSERSGAEIEFIEMKEFYLKQLEYKKEIKKIGEKIKFYPENSKNILDAWIDQIAIDWPISRRRFYATPIPIWYSSDEKYIALPPEGKYYTPWKENPPKDCEIYEAKNNKYTNKKLSDFPKEIKWIGETRVFDTWMDSSISELFILKYKTKKYDSLFKEAFPVSLRPQGKEIVRTWLYYTLLRGFHETKQPSFKEIWIHQHILDVKGKKMSKSLGNVIDPQEILKNYGAEALRLWSATEGNLAKQDFKCSTEKIAAEKKTINKLINIAKFILLFKKPKSKPKLTPLDELFINYIEDLTNFSDKQYEEYDFHTPMLKLRSFLWDILASHYIELVKNRAYNEEKNFTKEENEAAIYTLYYLLERFLILTYPIIPQVTSVIASNLKINLLEADFPKYNRTKSNPSHIKKIMDFNSLIWKTKKDKSISLREPILNIKIPKELMSYEKDLRVCHKLH